MDLLRVPLSGGVNLLTDPRNIRDDEVVKAGNMYSARPGVLQTRKGVGPIAGDLVNMTSSYPMSAMFGPWVDSPLFFTLFGIGAPSNITLYAYTLDGVAAMSPVKIFDFPDNTTDGVRPYSFQYAGRIYFLTGFHTAGTPAYSIGRGETTLTSFAFAGTGNSDLRPRLAVPYRNRIVWANFGTGYENTLVFSDNFKPDTVGNDVLAANGRNVSLVASADGDEIVGMVPIMLTAVGTPVESALLVLRRYSSFLIAGEPDQTTGGTSTLAVNAMSVAAGCISAASIQSTPYGIFWASHDDVWHFQTGQVPRPLGLKIRPALLETPRSIGFRISASYFDGFYRLCLFSEDQPKVSTAGVWDQYWLDLRDGAPQDAASARWWGPMRYNFYVNNNALSDSGPTAYGGSGVVVRDDRPGGTSSLYGVERNWNTATAPSFPTYGNIVKYDIDTPFDRTINTATSVAWTFDYTIKPDLITKEYDLGDPMLQKIYDGMEANVWASQTGRLLAEGILDGGQAYADTNIDVTARGFEPGVDITTSDGSKMPRAPQAVAAFDSSRSLGTTLQLRLQGQTGYVIDTTSNVFCWLEVTDDGEFVPFSTTIATGLYATLEALLTAIQTGMRAAYVCSAVQQAVVHNANGTVTISGGVTGTSFFPNELTIACFDGLGEFSQAQVDSTARLLTLLGFNTGANPHNNSGDPLIAAAIPGDMAVWSYNAPIWEINGLGIRLEVIPRRPV